MKKSIILAAAVAALAMFASCQKVEIVTVDEPGAGSDLIFTATIDNPATRTTINTDASDTENRGKVSWDNDDEISISDGTNTAIYSISSITDGKATFTYKSGQPLATSDVTYTATYGSEPLTAQVYSSNAGNLPMRATSTTTSLHFSVTCGLLKLNLTKTGESIKSIEVSDASNTYTLTCTDAVSIASGADFFIALPAGTYTKFVITDSNDKFCTIGASKSGLTIETGKIQPLSFESKLTFDYIWFPDANLRSLMLGEDMDHYRYDTNGDGGIGLAEARAITSFNCSGCSITDLTGLEYCVNITNLNVCNNTGITSADLTTLTKLTNLNIGNTGITTLDLSQNTELTWLSLIQCYYLTTIDLSKNTKLQSLSAGYSGLTSLNLNYVHPVLSELNLSNCTALKLLYLYSCSALSSLDLTGATALVDLFVPDCTSLSSLALGDCSSIKNVIIWGCTGLTTISGMKNYTENYAPILYSTPGLNSSIYKVGQLVLPSQNDNRLLSGSMGIVFKGSKILSLDEYFGTFGEYSPLTNSVSSLDDGKENTDAILDMRPEHNLCNWCTNHGTGWYLPALNEVQHGIKEGKNTVNTTIYWLKQAYGTGYADYVMDTYGLDERDIYRYWSSTTTDGLGMPYFYDVMNDNSDYLGAKYTNNKECYARAVFAL